MELMFLLREVEDDDAKLGVPKQKQKHSEGKKIIKGVGDL